MLAQSVACGCLLVALASGAAAQSITFAAFGDYGIDNAAEAAVSDLVHSWNPDFIITVGDNNYWENGLDAAGWERAIGQYYGDFILGRDDNRYPLQTSPTQRFFPAIGNHDVEFVQIPGGGYYFTRRGYLNYFHDNPTGTPRLPAGTHTADHSFYRFRRGPVEFFVLDSEQMLRDEGSRDEQTYWLYLGLQASTAPWKVVYMHHAPYSSGENGAHELMQLPYAQWGASAVLAGHDHSYERLVFAGGFPYFVTGLGGTGMYDFFEILPQSVVRYNAGFGAMRIAADERRMTFQFFAVDAAGPAGATLIDEYSLAKPIPEPNTSALALVAMAAVAARRRFGV